jgi:hypothetical protein
LAIPEKWRVLAGLKKLVERLGEKAAFELPEGKEINRKDQQGKKGGSVEMERSGNKAVQQEEKDENSGS